ncbi:hypothetical protein ES703_73962 [subsurface metagenome]
MLDLVMIVTDAIFFYTLYLIATLSLNMMFGYAGLPNFGLSFAVAGGAYVFGFLPGRLALWIYSLDLGLDYIDNDIMIMRVLNEKLASDPAMSIFLLLLSLVGALLMGGFLGYVASYPAIRLRPDYFMMTMIAMAEAVRVIGMNDKSLSGGTLGV